jgi:hypothetical protein
MPKRKPKDILVFALRNLVIGDGGIFCTTRTYEAIKDRLDTYFDFNHDRRIITNKFEGINHIRRVA